MMFQNPEFSSNFFDILGQIIFCFSSQYWSKLDALDVYMHFEKVGLN